jgi:hypothetical protein
MFKTRVIVKWGKMERHARARTRRAEERAEVTLRAVDLAGATAGTEERLARR